MTDQRFTDEDREQLRKMGECYGRPNPYAPTLSLADSDATRAALAHIDRLEGALREIEAVAAREDKVLPIVHTALKPAPTEQEEG